MDHVLYLFRDFGAAALVLLPPVTPLLSLIDTTRAVKYNLSFHAEAHSCLLSLAYLADFGFWWQWFRSRGELPDATACLSNALFLCVVLIHWWVFPTKVKAFGWYLNCAFWLVLHLIELFTAIRITIRPSLPSPYFQVGIALAAYRALTCLILLVLFLRSYHKGYRSLSELENTDPPNADTEDIPTHSVIHHDHQGLDAINVRHAHLL